MHNFPFSSATIALRKDLFRIMEDIIILMYKKWEGGLCVVSILNFNGKAFNVFLSSLLYLPPSSRAVLVRLWFFLLDDEEKMMNEKERNVENTKIDVDGIIESADHQVDDGSVVQVDDHTV